MKRKATTFAFLALALTSQAPQMATAQDASVLVAETSKLQSSDHSTLMRAASAACLLHPTDRKSILELLEDAKWTIGGDDEWIEAGFNDVWVTLLGSNDYFDCYVSGDISQAAALEGLTDMLSKSHWNNWTVIRVEDACYRLSNTQDMAIYISSAGNDPVCTKQPHSAIRIALQRN